MSDDESVAQYIFRQITESNILIENPVIAELVSELYRQLHEGEVNPEQLLHMSDPKLTRVVADLMSENLDISPHWSMYDVDVEPADINYKKDVEEAMLMLKVKNINKLIEENQQSFNTAKTDEEFSEIQQLHAHLLELRSELLKNKGTVVIK
jgi:hypothetical protein